MSRSFSAETATYVCTLATCSCSLEIDESFADMLPEVGKSAARTEEASAGNASSSGGCEDGPIGLRPCWSPSASRISSFSRLASSSQFWALDGAGALIPVALCGTALWRRSFCCLKS